MLRKIVTAIVAIPLLVIIVAFAVANRQTVTISFDPFDQSHPAAAVALPLFVLMFIVLIVGVIVGGVASWFRHGRWRRASRRLDAEVHALHGEVETLRRRFTELPQKPAEPPPQVPTILPPTP